MAKTTVKVEFSIKGDNFDPGLITQELHIEPKQSWMKNTDEKPRILTQEQVPAIVVKLKDLELKKVFRDINRRSSLGEKAKPRWFSHWSIATEDEESCDINIQLKKIYKMLKDKVTILNELRDKYSLSYTIEVVTKIEDNEKPSMYFEQYIIDFAHDVLAQIDIDLYIFS